MFRALVLCLFALVAMSQALQAQDAPIVAVDITSLSDGNYVLVKIGGQAFIRPLQLLVPGGPIPPGPAPTPTPTPIPPPGPAPLSDLAKQFQAAAGKVSAGDKQFAPQMAAFYRLMAQSIKDGKIPSPELAAKAVAMGTDMILAPSDIPGLAWRPVRDLMSDQWAALDRSGASLDKYGSLLSQAADGIEASSKKGISPEVWAMILKIVEMIITLLVNKP